MDQSKKVSLKTQNGVKYCTLGLGIFVLWQFSSASILDYILPLCGGLLLLFIALILIIIGFFNLYLGRLEYGKKHAENVKIGIVTLILGFIAGVSILAIPTSLQWSGNIATAVLYSLGIIYLLKEIIDKRILRFVILGGILFIIISISNTLSPLVIRWLASDLLESSENAILLGLTFMSINIIPWAIFTLAFLNAWKGIEQQNLKSTTQSKSDINGQSSNYRILDQLTTCPSCGFRLTGTEVECPECGYYFND
jgi:hypothetical protein